MGKTNNMGNCQSYDYSTKVYAVGMNNKHKKENESQIYRHPDSVDRDLFNYKPKYRTFHDLYKHILKENPKKEFLGKRYLNEKGELEKKFTFETVEQIFKKAEQFGSAMADFVKEVTDKEYNMKFYAIFSKNNYNLIISDIACCLQGITCVPMYDTLGDD